MRRFFYSFFSEFTGFLIAALIDCVLTVRIAIDKAESPVAGASHHGRSTR